MYLEYYSGRFNYDDALNILHLIMFSFVALSLIYAIVGSHYHSFFLAHKILLSLWTRFAFDLVLFKTLNARLIVMLANFYFLFNKWNTS